MDVGAWWREGLASIGDHSRVWGWSAGLSTLTFVGSLILVPVFLMLMPADYFARERRPLRESRAKHPSLRMVALVLKNLTGIILLVAGLAMLVLPGQGLLTLMAAAILLDYPGKFRLERWMMTVRAIRRPVQALRRKLGKAPFELADARSDPARDSNPRPSRP